jgi:hypothetical protein
VSEKQTEQTWKRSALSRIVPVVALSKNCFPMLSCYTERKRNFDTVMINIVDIRKDRGDNPLQDSPVKESAIRLFSETRHPTLMALRLN